MAPFRSKSIDPLSAYNHSNSMALNGEELRSRGASSGRWMALDVGNRRIGVAVSDPLRLTARPLTTLVRTPDEAEFRQLVDLLDQWEIARLIVGCPYRLTGESSDSTRMVEAFIARMHEVTDVPLERADERLSSKEAERLMAEMRIPIGERRAKRDAFAAALILEWYLGESSGNRK